MEGVVMEASLTKEGYRELRGQLEFRQRFLPNAAVLLCDAGLLGLAFQMAGASAQLGPVANWTLYLLAQLLFVVVFFHGFALLHECGHGSCSKNETVNTIVGHCTSLLCFMPYYPWKYIHAEHHTWAGNLHRDPTLKLVRDYEKSQKVKNWAIRLAWRTWIPLLALFQHIVFWTYPWTLYREGRLQGKRLWRSIASIVFLGGTYAAIATWGPSWVQLQYFWPALVIYLITVELINFPHHMGTQLFSNTDHNSKLPLWRHNEVTRSCYYPPGLADLLLLNFNFHTEHHLFPDLPWFRLGDARLLAKEALGDEYCETIGINWNLENRSKDATRVFLTDSVGGNSHWNLEAAAGNPNSTDGTRLNPEYEAFLKDVRLVQSDTLVPSDAVVIGDVSTPFSLEPNA
jgi:acyl-lipid omega-6 desaturase (Delta-12 desaturase)